MLLIEGGPAGFPGAVRAAPPGRFAGVPRGGRRFRLSLKPDQKRRIPPELPAGGWARPLSKYRDDGPQACRTITQDIGKYELNGSWSMFNHGVIPEIRDPSPQTMSYPHTHAQWEGGKEAVGVAGPGRRVAAGRDVLHAREEDYVRCVRVLCVPVLCM